MYNRIFKHKNIISYVIVLFLTILSFKTVCLSQRELAFIDDTGFPLGGTSSIAAMLNSAQIESVRETEGANARLVENRQTLIRSSLLRNAASFEAMPKGGYIDTKAQAKAESRKRRAVSLYTSPSPRDVEESRMPSSA